MPDKKSKNMLNLKYLEGSCDDERPLAVEIKMDDGTIIKGGVWSIKFADDAVTFCAVTFAEPTPKPKPAIRSTVKPMPSSPYIGPNGEFYPLGGVYVQK